jgi:serine/threonine protein kinase
MTTFAAHFNFMLGFIAIGSLHDFLRCNTVNWAELCNIGLSIARGLAHLHEELPAAGTQDMKPAVAHRDFKSKNVLIRLDTNPMSACISDFGLALIFEPSKPVGDMHGQVSERPVG